MSVTHNTTQQQTIIGKNLTSLRLSFSVYEMDYLPPKILMMTKDNTYKMYRVKNGSFQWLVLLFAFNCFVSS